MYSHSAIAMEYMATVGQREEDTGDFGAQTGYSDSEECAENGTGERSKYAKSNTKNSP